ncbi:hypothetical protein DFS34DRAFT_597255 [Phlyctochytrium arcticum]|nr:hypothetical protein DFS34DRAFT_597255 [Phlyctochytrium arcticum]
MSNTTYPPSSQGVVGTVDQSDYSVTGAFSTYTGKFQNVDRDARYAAPEQHFDQNSKAFRQMGFYFDTDKYQEERSQQRMEERMNPRKTQKLSKKDVEFYKQRKKEKKLRSLKARFGPD